MAVTTHHHVVLFPYMSKGHTIPLLQFGRLLLHHRRNDQTISVTVTVFTTPKNQPFVSNFLSNTPEIKVISLPFPENISGIPPGVESTEKLPSMSLYVPFTRATKLLQPFFEETLKNLPQVSFMVTDGFLWWTSESAAKFKIPRLVFYGINSYASAVSISVFQHQLFTEPEIESDTEPVTVPDFPWIRVKKCDFNNDATQADPKETGPGQKLFMDQIMSTATSHGFVVNSFYELESAFVDYNNNSDQPKSWCVGPLCVTDPSKPGNAKPAWIHWLDRMQKEGRSVLYVAFGTQAEISNKQLKEIALGLEDSKVNFLWVTRKDVEEIIGEGFKDRIKESGMIVRDWVDQWEILSHESIKGFLSHCGWNSAQESICVGVPLLAWPMMAEQPLNAKMVVEEVKVGVRVETQDGRLQGFVPREELSRKVKELMEGETGKIARKNVKEYSKMAKAAMVQGTGSSWKNLDLLLEELCKGKEPNGANK